ncbi:MAG: glycine oxidase ThiO [Candidatus Eremiobacteraeota bacterium]|nr:glycine oxidase ThiO [Candidatus Eremiobacteraeota bacterium]
MIEAKGLAGDVAIVGAGVIGLSVAFELAGRGATVRVYERGEPGRAASWAAAGMLAPHTEKIEDEWLLALCSQSLAMYPSFVDCVREASGIDAHLRLDGILNAAFDDAGMEELRAHAAVLENRGVAFELLDRGETIAREPALGSHVTGSLVLAQEGHVDNRRLGRALAAACEARGVAIVRDVHDCAVECDDRRVLGIRCHLGFAPAQYVVNAAGAWAARVPGIPAEMCPHVEPVKGQMLALAIARGFVRRACWVPGAYLVPRSDGRLLIGATVERAGFDERVTARGIAGLLRAALAAAPALGDFAFTESWAGLRPASADGRPFIGPSALDGLIYATGHYRNGILLAPVTARIVADCIEGAPTVLPRMQTA